MSDEARDGEKKEEETQETPAAEPTQEAPTVDETPQEPAHPDEPADTKRTRSYVRVPTWIAAVVGVIVLLAGGFALGRATAPDDGNEVSFQIPAGQGDGQDPFPIPRTRDTAFLGVATRPADGAQGVEITQVTDGSAADDAGLQTGDVITEVDGEVIEDSASLREAIASHEPGDEVSITYTRDGSSNEITAELGERPSTNN
jgi:membrane-associated protease RseP (regulator of RpoE activity)